MARVQPILIPDTLTDDPTAHLALAIVRLIDAGEVIHRRLSIEGVAKDFTIESCQQDQMVHSRQVNFAQAEHLISLGDRRWCGHCCFDLIGAAS